ncbi:MAG TPA: hypothetical protein VGO47_13860, partial [Chlamydiales bacterium]|nr:hypothetical protein [Chlamydiales bacterium]
IFYRLIYGIFILIRHNWRHSTISMPITNIITRYFQTIYPLRNPLGPNFICNRLVYGTLEI